MYETPEDLDRLQALLDDSYAAAGEHLLSIHNNPGWRLDAEGVVETLQGMCLLSLATVNSKGEPFVGPVDGLFYRGRFFFGSSPTSIRARHIRRNVAVSATHTPTEQLSVTVHGRAVLIDKKAPESKGYGEYLDEVYGQGNFWEGENPYWVIEPRKMFAIAPQV